MRVSRQLFALATAEPPRWIAWVPGLVLFMTTLLVTQNAPAWLFMWAVVFAMWAGCKWFVLWREIRDGGVPNFNRILAFMFLWVGMDAHTFLDETKVPKSPEVREWMMAGLNTVIGAVLIWCVPSRCANELGGGWSGMIGLVFILHFGVFHLLALSWQHFGIDAQPLMKAPALATSLGDFWGNRWNTAFNQIALDTVFRPLRRRVGLRGAMFLAFLMSGIVHDISISLPARAGFGLPTAYFALQGCGVLAEKSRIARALGLQRGVVGWIFVALFTAGPAFWLFHPAFVRNVVLPFLRVIGAL